MFNRPPYLPLLGKILLMLYLAACNPLPAAEITTEQALDFGTIAIGQQKSVSTLTICANGEIERSNQIHILQPGSPAEFHLINYPADTVLFVNATIVQAYMDEGNNESIRLVSLNTAPTVTTDANGFVSVTVGGTLQTSGPVNNSEQSTDYQAQIAIDIHY